MEQKLHFFHTSGKFPDFISTYFHENPRNSTFVAWSRGIVVPLQQISMPELYRMSELQTEMWQRKDREETEKGVARGQISTNFDLLNNSYTPTGNEDSSLTASFSQRE